MSAEDLTEFVLSGVAEYGPFIFGLTFLVSAAGVPLPSTPIMMAAGALVQRGVLNGPGLAVLGLSGVVAGDSCSYALGRFAGDWIERTAGRWRQALLDRARREFNQRGSWAIFASRCLFMSLDLPTNLVAGSSGYEYRRFLFYEVTGRGVWLLLYGSIGFIVGDQWERASQLVGRYTLWLGLALIAVLGAYTLFRRRGRK